MAASRPLTHGCWPGDGGIEMEMLQCLLVSPLVGTWEQALSYIFSRSYWELLHLNLMAVFIEATSYPTCGLLATSFALERVLCTPTYRLAAVKQHCPRT